MFRILLRGGLTITDNVGTRRPQLAQAVPTLENGLWRLLPDGRMETTWSINPTARWHDAVALTADDLLFTAAVLRDKQVPDFRTEAYDLIERVEASDAHTVTVTWTSPFIAADTLFSHELTPPFPRHLLEQTYREDKSNLTGLPYWREEYVGAGPYKLRHWELGSHATLEANQQYALGRPKIDEIEVRFISDANTRLASVLAGSVEVTLGVGFSVEQGMQAAQQWREGKVAVEFIGNWVSLFPQLINPNPPVLAEVRFRKAMMHGLDRQAMADTLQGGLVPVAHSYLAPNQPQYQAIEAPLVRYDYDPARATQLLGAIGYARGTDGQLRDIANQTLALNVRFAGGDISSKSSAAVADYWQQLGATVATEVLPAQRLQDLPYYATFPGFLLTTPGHDLRTLMDLHGSRARLPENNFRVAGLGNFSRYMNPEFDALIDRYFVTLPERERTEVLGQILYHVSDQLNVMPLFYNGTPEMIGNRLLNVTTGRPPLPASAITWNAHEWDLR